MASIPHRRQARRIGAAQDAAAATRPRPATTYCASWSCRSTATAIEVASEARASHGGRRSARQRSASFSATGDETKLRELEEPNDYRRVGPRGPVPHRSGRARALGDLGGFPLRASTLGVADARARPDRRPGFAGTRAQRRVGLPPPAHVRQGAPVRADFRPRRRRSATAAIASRSAASRTRTTTSSASATAS